MTEAQMLAKIEEHKNKSVGVKVITKSGNKFCYFYEDTEDSKGITKAMNEIYPLMNEFADVTFLS
mgnify:CR=1 FL=1